MAWMGAILIYWLLVIGIVAIPGMGMLLVLAHTLEHGRRAGFTVVAGIMSAGAVHVVWGAHRRVCGFPMYNQGGFAVTTTGQ